MELHSSMVSALRIADTCMLQTQLNTPENTVEVHELFPGVVAQARFQVFSGIRVRSV